MNAAVEQPAEVGGRGTARRPAATPRPSSPASGAPTAAPATRRSCHARIFLSDIPSRFFVRY